MESFIIYTLCVFAISSGWLYSELPKELRNWWLKKFKGRKYEHLAICQLCCGFWFAFVLYPLFFGLHWLPWTPVALAATGMSWTLGALTQYLLWAKVWNERQYKLSNGRELKNGGS